MWQAEFHTSGRTRQSLTHWRKMLIKCFSNEWRVLATSYAMGRGLGQERSCPGSRGLGFRSISIYYVPLSNPLAEPPMPYLCNVNKILTYWRQKMPECPFGVSSSSHTYPLIRWLPTRVEDIMAQSVSTKWNPRGVTGQIMPSLVLQLFYVCYSRCPVWDIS